MELILIYIHIFLCIQCDHSKVNLDTPKVSLECLQWLGVQFALKGFEHIFQKRSFLLVMAPGSVLQIIYIYKIWRLLSFFISYLEENLYLLKIIKDLISFFLGCKIRVSGNFLLDGLYTN